MKLTAVRPNNSEKTAYEIYIDGEYALTVEEEDYIRLFLYEKSEISAAEWDEIKLTIEIGRGFSFALKYLSRQKRTHKQTENYLLQNGFSEEAVYKVLQRLIHEKYIDDRDYANRYIRSRLNTTDKSMNNILLELNQRGIPEGLSRQLAAEYTCPEFERAYAAALKRFGSKRKNIGTMEDRNNIEFDDGTDEFGFKRMKITEKQKMMKKVYQFLTYRGYQQDIIYEVMEKMGLR